MRTTATRAAEACRNVDPTGELGRLMADVESAQAKVNAIREGYEDSAPEDGRLLKLIRAYTEFSEAIAKVRARVDAIAAGR